MEGYIINTDPHWLSFLFNNGIKNPVFWLKRGNNPHNTAISNGHPIFFRITGTNPPVIKGHGKVSAALTCSVRDAFENYGNRLGYSTVKEMIDTSSAWTSAIKLDAGTNIFCIEISDFRITDDIRTDTELRDISIEFDHKHIVTGKGLTDTQTESLLTLAVSREIQQVKTLVQFISDNVGAYVVDEFNPHDMQDARELIARLVAKRQGQPEFRKKLLQAYENKCAISGCDAIPTLEAAHIIPYKGPQTNHISNGLLLRSDIHTLFDLGLLVIDSKTMKVVLHPDLLNTDYGVFEGKAIFLPKKVEEGPSKEALDIHRKESGF